MDRFCTCSACLGRLAAVSLARAAGEGRRGQRAALRAAVEVEMVAAARAGLAPDVREVPGPHVLSWGKLCEVHPSSFAPQAMRVAEVSPALLRAFREASAPSMLERAAAWVRGLFGRSPRILGRGLEGNAYLANGSGADGG